MKNVSNPEKRPAAMVGHEIKTRVGQQLRVMYSEIMNQGVPDCHEELLQRLDALTGAARDQ